jgi:hypothetical protein
MGMVASDASVATYQNAVEQGKPGGSSPERFDAPQFQSYCSKKIPAGEIE